MDRVDRLRERVTDARGGRVVLLSHCLLNENVRYLGGAGRPAGVRELVDGYLERGIGIHQLPCPERHAWGGVAKRRLLLAYGAGGTWRAPLSRLLRRPFLAYTRLVYAGLARSAVREIEEYRRSGVEVVGVVGIGGSPSCGVRTTLDASAALGSLTRIPLRDLDRRAVDRRVIAAHLCPGEGMFVRALRRRLERAGLDVALAEHDLPDELGIRPRPGPREAGVSSP